MYNFRTDRLYTANAGGNAQFVSDSSASLSYKKITLSTFSIVQILDRT